MWSAASLKAVDGWGSGSKFGKGSGGPQLPRRPCRKLQRQFKIDASGSVLRSLVPKLLLPLPLGTTGSPSAVMSSRRWEGMYVMEYNNSSLEYWREYSNFVSLWGCQQVSLVCALS